MTDFRNFAARFGQFFLIPRLSLTLTLGSAFCFIFAMISPQFLPFIMFVPERVLAGEFWRLLSFIFYPFDLHPFFAFFTYYLFFLMGSALEQKWGAAKFNLYMFTGYLGTIAVAFLTPGAVASNYYIYLSVYLAFAALFPEFELYLFFVVPVKIKWLAWMVAVLTAVDFISAGWPVRLAILVSAANFLAFFGAGFFRSTRAQVQTIQTEIRTVREEAKPFHQCTICGMTEKSNPGAIFRVSNGLEYCGEHLPGRSS